MRLWVQFLAKRTGSTLCFRQRAACGGCGLGCREQCSPSQRAALRSSSQRRSEALDRCPSGQCSQGISPEDPAAGPSLTLLEISDLSELLKKTLKMLALCRWVA
ncbi:39S ribosomal protein L12 [Cricetulus griseus]|nr:39S ribosomal protein L12 [Cricetulus griseus]